MPIKEIRHVALRPISVFRHPNFAAGTTLISFSFFRSALPNIDFLDHGFRIFRKASRMTVTTPLGVEEMINFTNPFISRIFIFSITTRIPTSPNARRINIHNITTEITATNGRHTRWIELMRVVIQLFHKRSDSFLISFLVQHFKISWPIIFVS